MSSLTEPGKCCTGDTLEKHPPLAYVSQKFLIVLTAGLLLALTFAFTRAGALGLSLLPETTPTIPSSTPLPSDLLPGIEIPTQPSSGCDGIYCTFAVAESSDDAGPNPVYGCDFSTDWNEVFFGECYDGTDITSGFRFPNIAIPQGTQIAQAYLEFTVDGPYTDELTLSLYGENTGNAEPFTITNQPKDRDVMDDQNLVVTWHIPASDHWELNSVRRTPDLTAIVQAILNRQDWKENNALSIIVKNAEPASGLNRHRRVVSFDRPATTYDGFVPHLVIILRSPPEKGTVNVYVLNFNPLIDSEPLTRYKGWNEPDTLMPTFIADVLQSSGGVVTLHIARQSVIRTYPSKSGDFVFTNEQYLACLDNPDTAPYCRDLIDYRTVLNTRYDPDYVSACQAIATRGIDEIWLWGGPWFGYSEYNIIQPTSLCVDVDKRFTVMGFNYERGVAEMLHDLGHRAESVLQNELGLALWDQFDGQRHRYPQDYTCPASPDPDHPEVDPGNTHCGNVHFPPNAYCHYQYDRNFEVQSDCDDWINYPDLTGQKTTLNANGWGSDQRGFLKWWFDHFPRNPGTHDGLYNNWWKYIFSFNEVHRIYLPLVLGHQN